jgi:hypothetical protein
MEIAREQTKVERKRESEIAAYLIHINIGEGRDEHHCVVASVPDSRRREAHEQIPPRSAIELRGFDGNVGVLKGEVELSVRVVVCVGAEPNKSRVDVFLLTVLFATLGRNLSACVGTVCVY